MLKLTHHALERWHQRVNPEDAREDVTRALDGAVKVPLDLWPYFRVENAEDLYWAPTPEVLLVVREDFVVTVFRPRTPGQRALLKRVGLG